MIGVLEWRTWTTLDKTAWGDGPWLHEPDEIRWKDAKTGFHCMILRAGWSGHLCGYVGVPPTHPLYGSSYDLAYEYGVNDVHGGLTYSGAYETRNMHLDLWWFGFDCAHYGDMSPKTRVTLRGLMGEQYEERDWETYKDVAYVVEETTKLALQLVAED